MTEEELAEYYDNHSIMEDYIEAEKNGDVIVSRPGENYFDAIARHEREKAQKAQKTKPAPAFARPAPRRHVAAVAAV